MTSTQFLGYRTPSPLVCILARSLVLNSRNLPYYICIWLTPPPPPQCRHHISMAPNQWQRANGHWEPMPIWLPEEREQQFAQILAVSFRLLFDHSHIPWAEHAATFRTGWRPLTSFNSLGTWTAVTADIKSVTKDISFIVIKWSQLQKRAYILSRRLKLFFQCQMTSVLQGWSRSWNM